MKTPPAPSGYNTINPFIITADAAAMIAFLTEVFHAEEIPEAHTVDDDGLLLHSELKIGDSTVMVADRKPDWPSTTSLLQVYVADLGVALAAAQRLGARVVTTPTDFFGDILSRVLDPWGNLWWVYQHSGDQHGGDQQSDAVDWDASAADAGEDGWSSELSPELQYVHDSLLEAMRGLGQR